MLTSDQATSSEVQDSSSSKTTAKIPATTNNTNTQSIICLRCSCIILKPLTAILHQEPSSKQLPLIRKPGHEDPIAPMFWTVGDMMTFENIGFTHPDSSDKSNIPTRYLCCAECELGPIGYQESPKRFILAVDRVDYKSE